MKEVISYLKSNKIEIRGNKNKIEMNLFLSFLTVPVVKSKAHLGYTNGWTLYKNEDIGLLVSGYDFGSSGEYVDSLQLGKNLQNIYNNYVNPFYLFDIMNEDGKLFFANYYYEDVVKLIEEQKSDIIQMEKKLESEKQYLKALFDFQKIYISSEKTK